MSTDDPRQGEQPPGPEEFGAAGSEGREPTEDELRAAYEAQVKQLRVEHVVLENVVTLANLGMRRTGLAPGTEDERDPAQVRLAIESIRALLPFVAAFILTYIPIGPLKVWARRAAPAFTGPDKTKMFNHYASGKYAVSYPSGHMGNSLAWYTVIALLVAATATTGWPS